jgi:hypothetical protein
MLLPSLQSALVIGGPLNGQEIRVGAPDFTEGDARYELQNANGRWCYVIDDGTIPMSLEDGVTKTIVDEEPA